MPANEKANPLFEALQVECRRLASQSQAEQKRHLLSFAPGQIDALGQQLFSTLQTGGFCTMVVSGRHAWDPRSHYFEAARQAAIVGRKILRAFLLPHRQYRSDPALREHIEMDRAAGIQTEVLLIGDLLSQSALPLVESLDFGIWDESLLCTARKGSSGVSSTGTVEWRVSARPEDIQRAQELKNILLTKSPRVLIDGPDDNLNLEEPMISTAPIAQFLSTVLCKGDHVNADDCSWYHSVRQYLRIFNLVSTPTWHSDFYFKALARLDAIENPRVLISGTADYSMLAHVLWAAKKGDTKIDAAVLDLCETPLFLCKWYAKSLGWPLKTFSEDIMLHAPDQPYDCITTDAFLTRFPPDERQKVVAKWFSLLAPGGLAVTTTRIEKPSVVGAVRATPTQADSFRSRAGREAAKWADFLLATPHEIANRAQRYAERMVSQPIRSRDEVEQLFLSAGFEIVQLELVDSPGEMLPTTYAELVARRPL